MNYFNLKVAREKAELSQEELAKVLNVAQNTYSQYETGKIALTDEVLGKLANLYGSSVDYLMDRTDIKESYPKRKS